MMAAIKVPALGESISEAIVSRWLKQVGESVATDEPIVELETDKVSVEVPAPEAGVLKTHLAQEGDTVNVGDVIAEFDAGASTAAPAPSGADETPSVAGDLVASTPSARAEARRSDVDLALVQGSGSHGRVGKDDVQRHAASRPAPTIAAPATPSRPAPPSSAPNPRSSPPRPPVGEAREHEDIVRMTPLRKRIAERLVAAQQQAAILTTFNEADMSAVMALRSKYKEAFTQRHGVKLGFMSFFVKAAIEALRAFPTVNAEIRGDEIVYKRHYHVGVAVGGGKGLVVPVLRHADQLSFAGVESEIVRLATLARDNKLTIDDLSGGTFTISNGGVYGSMLSTPILNPPQTGILGLHNINQRPMAVDGNVEIRPMMYLALSYDHRLVDGREAVGFLVRIKEAIEDPQRLMLEV
ncbi:MAG: 2-oxoglutarate dehydrogenase complex dihydrolipoyllysine-residue succinyltransferase [Myxococcales bacterium FL481]|nr:MAG: 2-oxoglutarate dehydrogenase complex dihydrolipoyllysine-residue succinyltransferase [Myxococcales bacterium FL481]